MPSIIKYTFDEDYKLIDKFNSGSFCKLWSCMKRSSGQKRNAKILNGIHKKIANEDIFNTINELIIANEIKRHPYLLIMEAVYHERRMGKIILITDFTDKTLYDMINEKGVLTAYQIKLYTYQMLNGLQCLHENGFIHRDIKPQKMWVTARDQCLKIGDFETAYRLAAGSPYVGQDYAGTTQYRSPECLLSRGQCDTKTDVWSAGCVLYVMTTGQPLFDGVDAYDQLAKVDSLLGTPNRQLVDRFVKYRSLAWVERYAPGCCGSEREVTGAGLYTVYQSYWPAYALFKNMIVYDPIKRLSVKELLQQEYFFEMKDKENRLKTCTSTYMIPGCAKIPGKPANRRRVSGRTKKVSLMEIHQSSRNNNQATGGDNGLSFQKRMELDEKNEHANNNIEQEPVNFRLLEQQNYLSKEYADYVKRNSSTKQKRFNKYTENKKLHLLLKLNIETHNKDNESSVQKLREQEEKIVCCTKFSQKPVSDCLLDSQNILTDCTKQKSSTVQKLDSDYSENKERHQLPKLNQQTLSDSCIGPKSSTKHISDNVHSENKTQSQLPKLNKQAPGGDNGEIIQKRMKLDKNSIQKPVNPRLLNPQKSKKRSNCIELKSSTENIISDNVHPVNKKQCQLPKLNMKKINILSKKMEPAKTSELKISESLKMKIIKPRTSAKVVSNHIQAFSKPRVLIHNKIVKRDSHNQGPEKNQYLPWR